MVINVEIQRYKKCGDGVHSVSTKNNEFKMITNYIVVFAQVSFNATVRLKTR